ncbi:phosphopantetheine-binding protein [Sporichthya polymorpha]|uniref:phosphopantetheine-binding protein n=1 Tax=Sporichthya polymorpha TaxID=35751 RepID=UPI000382851B|nr:phosphopantetheine-binding protein [Sporichthya polymorpha]
MTVDARTTAEAEVLDVVRRLITETIGEEYLLDLEIGLDTSFEDDLEMESIEFVKFGAKLTEHYGGDVDFAGFLADKDLDEIIEMRVGTVVEYVLSVRS